MPLEPSEQSAPDQAPELSICPADAVADLQLFLNEHWRRNHVLASSRALLDWQHLDRIHSRYNFVIARNSTGRIDAILGFIPPSQFDARLESHRDLWLAIWKVRDGVAVAGLGLTLLEYLVRALKPRSIAAIGLAQGVVPIYRFLGFKVGKLDHHYIANRRRTHFSLLGNFDGIHDSDSPISPSLQLGRCGADMKGVAREIFSKNNLPAKSAEYLRRRYLEHPYYRYEVLALRRDGHAPSALLVVRKASHEGSHALRLVDYFGPVEALHGCRDLLQSLLDECDAEYLDFYCHGIPSDLLHQAGFLRRAGDVVVPNYFEPFEQRNVDLDFAYKIYGISPADPFRIFKGDSDQDRPSHIGEAP